MATATTPCTNPTLEAPANNQDTQVVGIYIDADQAKQEIAKNWKWILAGGIASVVTGILAIMAPVLATAAVAMFIAALLLVVGSINLAGLFFAPSGTKLESLLIGVVQVLLAAVMAFYPLASIVSLTG